MSARARAVAGATLSQIDCEVCFFSACILSFLREQQQQHTSYIITTEQAAYFFSGTTRFSMLRNPAQVFRISFTMRERARENSRTFSRGCVMRDLRNPWGRRRITR